VRVGPSCQSPTARYLEAFRPCPASVPRAWFSRRCTGYSQVMGEQVHGVAAEELSEDDLWRELEQLYETRCQTLRHGSDQALSTHTKRIMELEADYLRRYPQREVDPDRTREGARS
jgi:hypothetical protein